MFDHFWGSTSDNAGAAGKSSGVEMAVPTGASGLGALSAAAGKSNGGDGRAAITLPAHISPRGGEILIERLHARGR